MTEQPDIEASIKALRALDPPLSEYVADIVQAVTNGNTGRLTHKLYRAMTVYLDSKARDPTLPAPMSESVLRTAVQGLALGILPVEVNPCIDTLVEFLMNLQRAAIPGAAKPASPEERIKDPFCPQGKRQPWAR